MQVDHYLSYCSFLDHLIDCLHPKDYQYQIVIFLTDVKMLEELFNPYLAFVSIGALSFDPYQLFNHYYFTTTSFLKMRKQCSCQVMNHLHESLLALR